MGGPLPFEIIPIRRDRAAKTAYLYFRRYLRMNRKNIEAEIREATRGMLIDGCMWLSENVPFNEKVVREIAEKYRSKAMNEAEGAR